LRTSINPCRVRAELAATQAGLGVLLLNGSHQYMKGCGGVKLHRGTELDVSSLAFAHALFTKVHNHSVWNAKRHLEPTQAEALSEALDFLEGEADLIARLREAPELVASGAFRFEEKRASLFGKLFGSKKAAATPKKAARSPEEEARLREARQLIEEVGLFGE
jgi:hypothetical protein